MNILGLDYGEKHVGVALAEGPLAAPLTTLNTETAVEQLKPIVTKYNIEKIIIGDCPEDFLQNLKNICDVEQADETLSSHDARISLMHTTQTRRKEKEHAVAAAIILQTWMDSCKV
ncbi:MAG: RuvX/YqgF family protein [Patescibacteria group bacterium]